MPQLYNFASYTIYFWVNESTPTEPIHVHIAEKRPIPDGTKIWITRGGKTLLCHNKSKIPANKLRALSRFIEANSQAIVERWIDEFGEVNYFC